MMDQTPILDVPEQILVGARGEFNFGNAPKAYMHCYKTPSHNRTVTSSILAWLNRTHRRDFTPEVKTLSNSFEEGFKIVGYRSRYSTSNKLLEVEDPRGFRLEISVENLIEIVKHTTIKKGIIQAKAAWTRYGAAYLVVEGTPSYRKWYAKVTAPVPLKRTMSSLTPGDIISETSTRNTSKDYYLYLGKANVTINALIDIPTIVSNLEIPPQYADVIGYESRDRNNHPYRSSRSSQIKRNAKISLGLVKSLVGEELDTKLELRNQGLFIKIAGYSDIGKLIVDIGRIRSTTPAADTEPFRTIMGLLQGSVPVDAEPLASLEYRNPSSYQTGLFEEESSPGNIHGFFKIAGPKSPGSIDIRSFMKSLNTCHIHIKGSCKVEEVISERFTEEEILAIRKNMESPTLPLRIKGFLPPVVPPIKIPTYKIRTNFTQKTLLKKLGHVSNGPSWQDSVILYNFRSIEWKN